MNISTSVRLNNGKEIPLLGLGTYLSQPGFETEEAVLYALEYGYRHIDTATLYANEVDVGTAVRSSGIKREEIFITTKVWNEDQGYDKTLKAISLSLKRLKMDYIDLYLVHWPVPNLRKDTWKALERLYSEGSARSIGVSNYTINHLKELFSYSDIVPAVNQVEFSPYLFQRELLEFCLSYNIYSEAYSPLVRGRKFTDPRLVKLAADYGKTPAQILIRWALQMGLVVIPKSVRKERILSNASVFDFNISEEDMELLNSFNENFRVAWDPSRLP